MYSTGNHIQYLVITYNGKESEKVHIENILYIKLNHFAVYLKLTQHCESTILQFLEKVKLKKKNQWSWLEQKILRFISRATKRPHNKSEVTREWLVVTPYTTVFPNIDYNQESMLTTLLPQA